MKNGNALLSDTTIISFPFYFKLAKRYYFISIITPVITSLLAINYYINQSTYFIKTVRFSLTSSSSASGGSPLSSLMGGGSSKPQSSEIIGDIQSRDFTSKLVDQLLKRTDFDQLSFAPLSSKKPIPNKQLFISCGSMDNCIKDHLMESLPNFYSIEKSPISGTILLLKVKTLDLRSTNILLEILKDSLVKKRVQDQHRNLKQQKQKIQSLIQQEEEEIKGYSITDTKILIQSKREEVNSSQSKISTMESSLQKQNASLEKIQSKIEQTSKVLNQKKPSAEDLNLLKDITSLNREIKGLESNIQQLEFSNIEQGSQDEEILIQLKRDLNQKRILLRDKQSKSSLHSDENIFLNKKSAQKNDLNFEYRVLKNQIQKTKRRLSELKNIQSYRKEEVKALQQRLERLAPLFEYIKVLKKNLIQTTLMESAISPDVVFDREAAPSKQFKRTTRFKILLFASILSTFILMATLTIRYLLDPRILDEDEIKKTYKDLDVIGKTPDFRS